MRDNETRSVCCADISSDPARLAERLATLAREARLLEFALDGIGDGANRIASDLEAALEDAMDADSDPESLRAALAIESVLSEMIAHGMQLSAELSDLKVDGVLGAMRMPVLTAVLRAGEFDRAA